MVLRPRGRGRVGRRRHLIAKPPSRIRGWGLCPFATSLLRRDPPARIAPSAFANAPSRNRHRRRQTERRQIHAPQPHRRREAQHRQRQAAVDARPHRRHPTRPTTSQMIVLDTPGLLNPRYALQRAMRATALARARTTPTSSSTSPTRPSGTPPPLVEAAAARPRHRARQSSSALNKVDRAHARRARRSSRERVPDARFVSALTGEGVDELLARVGACAPRESVPLSRGRDQHADRSLLRRGARARDGARAARRRSAVQRRVRDRGVSRRRSRPCTFGRSSTSSARARSASSSAPAASASATSAAPRARRSKRSSARAVYLDLWVKVLPNWRQERQRAAALRLSTSTRIDPHDALPAAARHPRLPEVQGRARVSRGGVALVCHSCRLRYPVRDDIPIMLIDEATPL